MYRKLDEMISGIQHSLNTTWSFFPWNIRRCC